MFKSLFLAALFLCAGPALAQQQCVPTPSAYEQMTTRYNEARIYAGVLPNGSIAELWASPAGTFSVLITDPRGMTCMIASGENGSAAPAPALAPNL